MIRVLVSDDSITVRKVVAERLTEAGLTVIGEACNGAEAVEMTRQLKPDVILMDVVMPEMDGLTATARIMASTPTPVVILSAYATQKEVFRTFEALELGALEVCSKPAASGPENAADWRRLITTVRAAVRVEVKKLKRGLHSARDLESPANESSVICEAQPKLVIIGASTGGPTAVKRVLSRLPSSFPLPVIVAIHCARQMAASMGGWFDDHCTLNVRDARPNEQLDDAANTVLTAVPGYHLAVVNRRLEFSGAHHSTGHVPSINQLFSSAARCYGRHVVGVLLTGMGADGADGLKEIYDSGGMTMAQDERSSVVFGMPGAAVRSGAVRRTASPEQIGDALSQLCAPGSANERLSVITTPISIPS